MSSSNGNDSGGVYDQKTFVAILKTEISWLSVHCPRLSALERLERALAEADRVDNRLRVTAGRYVTPRHYSADVFVAMPRGQLRSGALPKKLSVRPEEQQLKTAREDSPEKQSANSPRRKAPFSVLLGESSNRARNPSGNSVAITKHPPTRKTLASAAVQTFAARTRKSSPVRTSSQFQLGQPARRRPKIVHR